MSSSYLEKKEYNGSRTSFNIKPITEGNSVPPIKKKSLFNKFGSLFRGHRSSRSKLPRPAAEYKPMSSQFQVSEENDTNSSVIEKSTESNIKILNVTIELEANESLKQGNKKGERVTNDKGNVLDLSTTNLTELTKMPLFVVDSNERLVINPNIKIQTHKTTFRENKMIEKNIKKNNNYKHQEIAETVTDNRNTSNIVKNLDSFPTIRKLDKKHLSIVLRRPKTQDYTQKPSKINQDKGTDIQKSFLNMHKNMEETNAWENKQNVLILLNPKSKLTSNDSVEYEVSRDYRSGLTMLYTSTKYSQSSYSSYNVQPINSSKLPNEFEDDHKIINYKDSRQMDTKNYYNFGNNEQDMYLNTIERTLDYAKNKARFSNFSTAAEENCIIMNNCGMGTSTSTKIEEVSIAKPSSKIKCDTAYLLPITSLPPKDIKKTLKLLKNAREKIAQIVYNHGDKKHKMKKRRNKPLESSSSSSLSKEEHKQITCNNLKQAEGTNTAINKKNILKKTYKKSHSDEVQKLSVPLQRTQRQKQPDSNINYVQSKFNEYQVNSSYNKKMPNHFLGISVSLKKEYQNPAIVLYKNYIVYNGNWFAINRRNLFNHQCIIQSHKDAYHLTKITRHIMPKKFMKINQTHICQIMDMNNYRSKNTTQVPKTGQSALNTAQNFNYRKMILIIKSNLNDWTQNNISYGTQVLVKISIV